VVLQREDKVLFSGRGVAIVGEGVTVVLHCEDKGVNFRKSLLKNPAQGCRLRYHRTRTEKDTKLFAFCLPSMLIFLLSM
jgi:hypothetical protein